MWEVLLLFIDGARFKLQRAIKRKIKGKIVPRHPQKKKFVELPSLTSNSRKQTCVACIDLTPQIAKNTKPKQKCDAALPSSFV